MKNDIETRLREVYRNVPPAPRADGMANTIIQGNKILQATESQVSFLQFFFRQFGFIRKKVWFYQIGILLICSIGLFFLYDSSEIIAILSAASPLIVLSSISEIARSYVYETMEIEISTRFSFKQLMITRICIIGLMDIFFLTILMVISGLQLSIGIFSVIIYICVPFLLTCFGCLWVLNHFKQKDCNYYCVALGLFISFALGMISYRYPSIYEVSAIWCWVILFIIAFIGVMLEVFKMIKNCKNKMNEHYLCNI